ncbi:RagB/SusD family nutrient uptake outer membrane protein [Flavivirga sp. 57AJ16]|uniref:RagB/SusD family nutrient uptake outer membrane protein n=1 Tax=Flavivirga sp. 57AJ16 TaxID=3025307 RepID=UPI002366513B|nr:RagB/SusD family nutrient uptake outer membrane protein [Flavivirga sp. 57AJ16]MDD7886792.1 RagB/SusD family nutrient uptake outer membrane protein [Flavivirga sp. 57AJ16]
MKYKYCYKYILSICCIMLIACDDYLDIDPKGKTTLVTVEHYDQWLNDLEVLGYVDFRLDFLGDNVDISTLTLPTTVTHYLAYLWEEQYNSSTTANPHPWGDHYASINKYNSVLVGIDDATEGTEEKRNSLKAEALLGRALEYLYLVNEYGPVYNSTTADEDLSVPFVTSNDVGESIPSRATVQDIYEHIIDDIETAIPDLPTDNSTNRFRGSVAAAYSVLARTYLYMGEYTMAAQNAQRALDNGDAAIIDFNEPLPAQKLLSLRPDVIYARQGGFGVEGTLDFMRMYDPNDLRIVMFYASFNGYSFTERGDSFVNYSILDGNRGTSAQEMKLIIAESAARNGDLSTALQQLNDIRMNRFSESDYEELESTDQEMVLDLVLKERALELPFNGLRWFDMRRLDKEGKMSTIQRYLGNGELISTLSPNSPKYTLQIPVQVMVYHPDWIQNPWEE